MSMSLKYEPTSEPLHISVKQLTLKQVHVPDGITKVVGKTSTGGDKVDSRGFMTASCL